MVSWLLWIAAFWFPWQGGCPRQEQMLAPLTPRSVDAWLQRLRSAGLAARIDFWSRQFFDAPYVVDPLGEGEPPDMDPPLDFCRFDCETYVETVLALAFSENLQQVETWMDRMRYIDGIRDFRYRYYTMALHWIPGNEAYGYLEPVLFFPSGKVSRRIFPEGKWAPEHRGRFDQLGERAPRGIAEVPYNSLSQLLARQAEIPAPALAFLVGAPLPGNPFLIMHMGFVLDDGRGKLVFRHASRTRNRMRVEERPFGEYLRSLYKHFNDPAMPRRPVLGLRLYRIREPRR